MLLPEVDIRRILGEEYVDRAGAKLLDCYKLARVARISAYLEVFNG